MPNSRQPTRTQLSLERTRDAMSADKASVLAADLRLPQEWGLAVQEHPAAFEAIKYASRFLDQPCLALFDRGGLRSQLQVKTLGLLNNLDAAADWLDERKASLVWPDLLEPPRSSHRNQHFALATI